MKSRHRLYRLRYVQVPGIVVITVIVMIVAAFALINRNMQQGIDRLQGQVTRGNEMLRLKQKELAEMTEKIQLASTDSFIANEARTRYGFLSEGEIRFVVTNPEVLYGTEDRP